MQLLLHKQKKYQMKTLKMNLESIQGKLSRNEMKNIAGGANQPPAGGSCCYTVVYYSNSRICGVSQYDAISGANYWASQGYRSFWCCESC